jgi:hypothetical protein
MHILMVACFHLEDGYDLSEKLQPSREYHRGYVKSHRGSQGSNKRVRGLQQIKENEGRLNSLPWQGYHFGSKTVALISGKG